MQESVEKRSENGAITMPMETKSMVFRGSPKWISEMIEEICEDVAFRNGEITQMTQSTIKQSIVVCIIYKIPMDVKYIPEEKAPATLKVVGICAFEDARKEKGKETIGLRYRPGNKVDLLNLKGLSLSESVTQAVRDYFAEKGFEVTDCKGWDKSPGGLDRLPKDLSCHRRKDRFLHG